MIDLETAREFFLQLEQFSRRARAFCAKTETLSPWGHDTFEHGNPDFCVIHYTASADFASTVNWFCNPKQEAKASAHVVIARSRQPWADAMIKNFPLIAALPVTVVQCRLPQQTAWHATWTNDKSYGIELVNCGEIKGEPGHYTWWPEDWKATYPHAQAPWVAYGRQWESWPIEQVRTCALLAAYANVFFSRSFREQSVLGHEHVQGVKTHHCGGHDKRDPGPLFPLEMVRQAVITGDMTRIDPGQVTIAAALKRHADIARNALPMGNRDDADAFDYFFQYVASEGPNLGTNKRVVISILQMLGYAVSYSGDDLMAVESLNGKSMRIFKTLCGIPHETAQEVVRLDAETCVTLKSRLFDRFKAPQKALV